MGKDFALFMTLPYSERRQLSRGKWYTCTTCGGLHVGTRSCWRGPSPLVFRIRPQHFEDGTVEPTLQDDRGPCPAVYGANTLIMRSDGSTIHTSDNTPVASGAGGGLWWCRGTGRQQLVGSGHQYLGAVTSPMSENIAAHLVVQKCAEWLLMHDDVELDNIILECDNKGLVQWLKGEQLCHDTAHRRLVEQTKATLIAWNTSKATTWVNWIPRRFNEFADAKAKEAARSCTNDWVWENTALAEITNAELGD